MKTESISQKMDRLGLVYIWAKDYTENWSAFAPDFKELEENEEYVEREDEFDLIPETEKVKGFLFDWSWTSFFLFAFFFDVICLQVKGPDVDEDEGVRY